MQKLLPKIVPALIATALLAAQPTAAQTQIERKPQWQKYFRDAKVNGSILIYDLKNNRTSAFNLKRANTSYVPASTFKILNSLIALETKVVRDENEVFIWDGIKREIPAWNKSQDMKTALQNSTVWVYQSIARRIGPQRMQEYVSKARYGNQNIGGGIDQFWLTGDLRISSIEQINFLLRIYQDKLPFSPRSTNIVKRILIEESGDGYVLRAKSGLEGRVGWWVGYVERRDNVYFFATNFEIVKPADVAARRTLTKNVLRDLKIIN